MEENEKRTLRIGVIGLRHGRGYLTAARDLAEVEVTSVCDVDTERVDKVAAEFGVAHTCTDYREMLARPDVDAVCVCTPDHMHLAMVTDAFRAGKHVFCEKPLALRSDECEAMLCEAERTGLVFMIGQICRFTPAFVKAKKIVDEGMIGELTFVESEYAHDYSYMGNDCWRADPAVGRHGVTGGGCHAVDLLRWIAGNPTEAFGYGNKKVLTAWPCDDTNIGVLKFPNGVLGKVFVSTGCKRNYTMRTVLYGTKGTVIVDNKSSTMSLFLEKLGDTESILGTEMKSVEMKLPVEIAHHNIKGELKHFCDVLLHGAENTLPAREGAATVAVCEALIRSAETGNPEPVRYPQ